jgi:hypothetical protein
MVQAIIDILNEHYRDALAFDAMNTALNQMQQTSNESTRDYGM